MTTPIDVGIRMELLDNEVKRDVGQVRTEFQRLNRDLKSSGTAAKTTTADYDRMRVAAARLGDAAGTGLSRVLIAQHRHAGILSGSIGRLVTGYAALNAAQRGFTAVADMQDASKSFEGFVGSQREAVELAKQLQSMGGPFGTSGLITGAQELLAHNTAAKDVVPILKAISDAVAGTGGNTSKLTAATSAIADLRSSTYLTSGALSQLTSQGIPAVDLLAKAHGMTAESLQRTLDAGGLRIQGKQAADELLKGMTERYKGAAAGDTSLRGAVTSLGNAASKSLYQAIGPELPQITAFVHSMAGELPVVAKAASPFLHVLGATLGFMAEHPHLTEGLAGFLIFRQVAGPAIRMATAMFEIGRALKTIKSSEEVLLLLRSLGGMPGGLPGMPGSKPSGTTSTMPPVVVPTKGSNGWLSGSVAKDAAAVEAAAVAGARFGTKWGGRLVSAGKFAGGVFAGNPGTFDVEHPDVKAKDQGLADQIAAAQKEIQARTGLTRNDVLHNRAKNLTPAERGLLMGMSGFAQPHQGHGLLSGPQVGFNADAARRDLSAYSANVALNVSVASGPSAADIQAALLASVSSPEMRKRVQEQIDADRRASAARKRVPVP